MDTLVFFLVVLAFGSANPIGPTTTDTSEPSRDDRIKTAIGNNVLWLLSGIRNGSFVGPDFPRAVVSLFLAEPGFFSPGHEIGQELRDKIKTALTELIGQRQIQAEDPETRLLPWDTAPSFIPSVELALYLQALLVSCVDPYDFIGYDLTYELRNSVLRHHCDPGIYVSCTFPSPAMLALCNARATSQFSNHFFELDEIDANGGTRSSMRLTDEEEFLTMTFGCLESSNYPYPMDIPSDIRLRHPIPSSGYRHYPSNLTIEDFHEMVKADGEPLGNTTSLFGIAAAMQNLMYNHHLRVSDLPWAVDFLLNSQDEDGSWGQSALNSFFVLPVLSNKSFLDITSDHCSEGSDIKTLVAAKGSVAINILNDGSFSHGFSDPNSHDTSLYGALTHLTFRSENASYHNGTDGKPYLYSLINKDNNPETGYFWFTYEQTKWPKESFTLLTQSHADIQLKRSSRYLLWYRKKK